MKTIALGAAATLLLTLVACNGSKEPSNAQAQPSPASSDGDSDPRADQTFAASGTVTEVKGSDITISHGPVPEIGWPAMTMTFTAERPELAASVRASDRVSFEFRKSAGGAILTSLSKL